MDYRKELEDKVVFVHEIIINPSSCVDSIDYAYSQIKRNRIADAIVNTIECGIVEEGDLAILEEALENLLMGGIDMTQVQSGKWSKYVVRKRAMKQGSFSTKFATKDHKWVVQVDGLAIKGDKVVITRRDGTEAVVVVSNCLNYDAHYDTSYCSFTN